MRKWGLLVAPFPNLTHGLIEADTLAARAVDERILSLACLLAEVNEKNMIFCRGRPS